MQKWEYMTVESRDVKMNDELLAKFGNEAWELVTVTHESGFETDLKRSSTGPPDISRDFWESWMFFLKHPI
jgi:hypothetical protein